MSDMDAIGTSVDPKEDIEPSDKSSRTDRFRRRLKNIGALVASVAAIGAVISGLIGYWSAWKVISNDFFKKNIPPQTIGFVTKGPSVAVLPISNPTKITAVEPLADTVTQQLVSSLGKFSLLRITSRPVAASFTKSRDAVEAARASGVDYLITGEMRAVGQGARASIEVADLRSGAEVWSRSLDIGAPPIMDANELSDVSASQISGAIEGAEYKKIKGSLSLNSAPTSASFKLGSAALLVRSQQA